MRSHHAATTRLIETDALAGYCVCAGCERDNQTLTGEGLGSLTWSVFSFIYIFFAVLLKSTLLP